LVQFFSLQVGSAILFRLDMQMFEATQELEANNAQLREQAKSIAKSNEARRGCKRCIQVAERFQQLLFASGNPKLERA
jgi:hypothetical protein